MADILAELGLMALGSRFKRLAERMQADAAEILTAHNFETQPSHFPLLAALDRYGALTVSEAVDALGVSQPAVTRSLAGVVELGWAETSASSDDARIKRIVLTAKGREGVARMKREIWGPVLATMREIASEMSGSLIEQIGQLETALEQRSLVARVPAPVRIVEFSAELAEAFYDINAEWISAMYSLEAKDREILSNPRAILDRGGIILFAVTPDLGPVGTLALMQQAPGLYELTKMGVLTRARGRGAGEMLMNAVLDRASRMKIETLYLLSNKKSAAAIHLYEKAGFVHDAEIMRKYGASYQRCDVAMSYPLELLARRRK